MEDYGNKEMMMKYGLVYDIFGIYLDWRIDHNIFSQWGIKDPNGIESFQDLYHCNQWQVVMVQINGVDMIAIDVELDYFSYCGLNRLNKVVLEEQLCGKDVLGRLGEWHKKSGISPLDQLEFYLTGIAGETAQGEIEIAVKGVGSIKFPITSSNNGKH